MSRAGPRPRLVLIAVIVAAALGALLAVFQGPAKHRPLPHAAPGTPATSRQR